MWKRGMWKIKLWYLRHVLGDDAGIGVVEMILILVVLIGLVMIFRNQLKTLVENIFKTITTETAKVKI